MSSTDAGPLDRILILGASGQLGAALVAQDWPVGTFVLPATRDQIDLGDAAAVRAYISQWRPKVVINAAAFTAVDTAEDRPELAAQVNHRAVQHLVDAVGQFGGRLIHISTDYVFDGATPGWYTEHDQVNPLSVYGRSKRAGELCALSLPDSLVIRTSWLYSSTGHNFVRTIRRLGRVRHSLEVVDDQYGCPTSADELAAAIVVAIRSGLRYTGVFHVASPDDATWWDVADEVLRLDGTRDGVRLARLSTDQYPLAARRPADSRISSDAFAAAYGHVLSPWRDALRAVSEKLDRQDLDHNMTVNACAQTDSQSNDQSTSQSNGETGGQSGNEEANGQADGDVAVEIDVDMNGASSKPMRPIGAGQRSGKGTSPIVSKPVGSTGRSGRTS